MNSSGSKKQGSRARAGQRRSGNAAGKKTGNGEERPTVLERRKQPQPSGQAAVEIRELHALARELLEKGEHQQKAISRELHDNIAQALSAITVRISLAKDAAVSAWVRQELNDLREQLKGAIDDVRTLASALRPPILDHDGFADALKKQADALRDRARITLDIQVDPKAASILDSESLTHLFRLAQEAMQNIEKHSEATRAWMRLEQRDGHMQLEIGDNGNGFSEHRIKEAQRDGHLGLLGMRERAQLLGGRFLVEAAPNRGTTISVTVPTRKNRGNEIEYHL